MPLAVLDVRLLCNNAQAFKSMPQPVRSRLAKACQGLQLPAGAVVFEEDDKGEAMYVVVSGTLQVRARPMCGAKAGLDGLAAQQHTDAINGFAAQAAGVPADSCSPGLSRSKGARRLRATTDAVCAGAADGGGQGGRGRQSQLGGSRRATWEGANFTSAEQGRLEAVRTALEAERMQVGAFLTGLLAFKGNIQCRALTA